MTVELTLDTIGPYLRDHGILDGEGEIEADSLGGGVSNHVFKVRGENECLVVKQPLPNLAVDDHWPADVSRIHNEATAARTYNRIIEENNVQGCRVPAVRFETRQDHVLAQECVPERATVWKEQLLDRTVDPTVARTLGRVLGTVQREAAAEPDVRETFDDITPFEQLRLDPYHRTTAERHPDVAELIQRETDRLLNGRRTLVHGDYSPKNVLVEPTDDGPEVWIIDFEVAHWGAPWFDTSFLLNHLFLKAVYNPECRSAYLEAARAFWDAYDEAVAWNLETETVAELAVLMLARVDGKSPVEYITESTDKATLRTVAKRTLHGDATTLEEFITVVEAEVSR